MGTKALFFDIDGTLIDNDHGVGNIPASVVAELERLHAAGHRLAICSGRPYTMIDERFRLPVFDAYVCCNGAQVEADGQTIYLNRLDPQVARDAADLMEELGCDYMLETPHHVYIDPRFHDLRTFFEALMSPEFFTFDFDRDEVLQRTMKLEANVLDRDRQHVLDALASRAGHEMVADRHGTENAFELYSATISKATGIAKVLDHYGIAAEDSYGFGDGSNDLEMIRACGTGVAMGNAVDELKAEADIVCGAVVEDGLARVLRELLP